jgi:hypothetical protein
VVRNLPTRDAPRRRERAALTPQDWTDLIHLEAVVEALMQCNNKLRWDRAGDCLIAPHVPAFLQHCFNFIRFATFSRGGLRGRSHVPWRRRDIPVRAPAHQTQPLTRPLAPPGYFSAGSCTPNPALFQLIRFATFSRGGLRGRSHAPWRRRNISVRAPAHQTQHHSPPHARGRGGTTRGSSASQPPVVFRPYPPWMAGAGSGRVPGPKFAAGTHTVERNSTHSAPRFTGKGLLLMLPRPGNRVPL